MVSYQKCNFKVNLISYEKKIKIHAPVLLNVLNLWQKAIKCEASFAFHLFSSTPLINSIIHEHSCKISIFRGGSRISGKGFTYIRGFTYIKVLGVVLLIFSFFIP